MREIKFRAWDVKSERISDPFYVGWKLGNIYENPELIE
jgi:hypothetical protein